MEGLVEKRRYPSAQQTLRLCQLLEADPELRRGKFTSTFTQKVATARWEKVALELNSMGGVQKTGMKWRKKYIDMKCNVKKKYSGQKKGGAGTGGGPPDESCNFNDPEEIILSTMSQAVLSGHSDSQESRSTVIDLHSEQATNEVEIYQIEIVENEVVVDSVAGMEPHFDEIQSEPTRQVELDAEPTPSGSQKKTTKPRTVAQKRLQQSLETAQLYQKTLQEKIRSKNKFYEELIKEKKTNQRNE